jgi:transcription antitermination factor NusG
MPILPPEPDIYPADLLETPSSSLAAPASWWVLHTLPRQEKSLARQLSKAHLRFYLPLIRRRNQYRNRSLVSQVPLFTSYLFLHGTDEDRIRALATKRVLHTLAVPDPDGLVRDLRQIRQLIATGAPITPEAKLQPGEVIEIRAGPLKGLRGKIIRRRDGGRRFLVAVDFIQRGASIELNEEDLLKV